MKIQVNVYFEVHFGKCLNICDAYVINSTHVQHNILRVIHLDARKDIIVNNII